MADDVRNAARASVSPESSPQMGTAKPRNPRHFETIEGGRDSVSDAFCTKMSVFPT